MSLSNLIWNVADDELRGLFKPHEYGSVILPFVVLRRLDCVLEPYKDVAFKLYQEYKGKLDDPSPIIKKEINLPFYNTSKYDLSRLKSDPQNIQINFDNYIQGYSDNVFDIIENFDLKKVVDKLNKKNILYKLIDKFTEVDLHPDKLSNHEMGGVYEELLRRFSEMSNEESGDHYTPRDIVQLLVSIVFEGDRKRLQSEGKKIRSIYDSCCGTGGMLTVGKKWILENIDDSLIIDLYGQELNDTTYAICKSDFLILGEDPENIKGPNLSSLSRDQFEGQKFDYMIVNPPFGISWSSDEEYILNELEDPNGRFIDKPRISDGSFLFLQHLIDKMNPSNSRIGIIFNQSPLYSGDVKSGENKIRSWIFENDLVETIIELPDEMFFNTPIQTFIWILSNNKSQERKNKVQLIDATDKFQLLRKKLNYKRKEITDNFLREILAQYKDFLDSSNSRILDIDNFKYIKVPLKTKSKKKYDKFEILPFESSLEQTLLSLKGDVDNKKFDKLSSDNQIFGYEVNFKKYFPARTDFRDSQLIIEELEQLGEKIDF